MKLERIYQFICFIRNQGVIILICGLCLISKNCSIFVADIPDDMETSEVSDKIDLTDLKGLSVKITGDDRSVSVDTKEINDESIGS